MLCKSVISGAYQLTEAHFVITDFGALRGFASRTPKCVGSLLVCLSADEFSIWMRQVGTLDFNAGTCSVNGDRCGVVARGIRCDTC